MVIGSSGRPPPVISCRSALPIDVTRRVTCMDLPSISACGGTVATLPSHVPARALSLSKDFCASDCANAAVESDIRTTDSIKRSVFIFHSPHCVELDDHFSSGVSLFQISDRLRNLIEPVIPVDDRPDRSGLDELAQEVPIVFTGSRSMHRHLLAHQPR